MKAIWRQALWMAHKDTRIFFRDRFAAGFMFLLPFLFVFGFSLALRDLSTEDGVLELAIATQERAGIGAVVIEALVAEADAGIRQVDYAEALAAVEAGTLAGFVAFPADFSAAVLAGRPTALEVVLRDENGEVPAALRGLAQSIAARISDQVLFYEALARLGGEVALPTNLTLMDEQVIEPAIEFEIERLREAESFRAENFTLSGYLTMFVFFGAALSAEAIARERQAYTLERLLANGVRREAVVLGKFIGIALRGTLQVVVLWLVGIPLFGVAAGASPAAVIVISVLMVLASAGAGLLLASLVSDVRAARSAGILASLILAPLGGCWWPLFTTPRWMQSLAKLTPHGWANDAFNRLILFGAEFDDVRGAMVALLGFTAVFLALASWRFRLAAE